MDKCEVCGAPTGELRRGRCWGCYSRWVEARPVGYGASCRVCGERRRGYLRSMELMGAWSPICHNCAARVDRLHPMPPSMDALRTALHHERRQPDTGVRLSQGELEAEARREGRVRESDLDRARTGERRAGERRAALVHAAGVGAGDGPVRARAPRRFADSAQAVALDDDEEMLLELAELASELEAVADDLTEAADLTRIHDLGR